MTATEWTHDETPAYDITALAQAVRKAPLPPLPEWPLTLGSLVTQLRNLKLHELADQLEAPRAVWPAGGFVE